MTQTRPEPKVIVIPAKEESPQDQEKKKISGSRILPRVHEKDEQLNSYEKPESIPHGKIMANPDWTMADIFADHLPGGQASGDADGKANIQAKTLLGYEKNSRLARWWSTQSRQRSFERFTSCTYPARRCASIKENLGIRRLQEFGRNNGMDNF